MVINSILKTLIIFAFFPLTVFAQSPAPQEITEQETVQKTSSDSRPLRASVQKKYLNIFDDLEFEREFIMGSSQVMNDEKWRKLAMLNEKFAYLFCYLQNPDRNLRSAKKDPECQYYLDKLKKFIPDNIIYICAANKIDSKECEQAGLNQMITTDNMYTSEKLFFNDQRELLLPAVDQAFLNAYSSNSISDAYEKFRKKKRPETWENLVKISNKTVVEKCRGNKIYLVNSKPADYLKASNIIKYRQDESDPLYRALQNYEKDPERLGNLKSQGLLAPAATPQIKIAEPPHPFEKSTEYDPENFNAEPFWRVRVIDQNCMEVIEEVLAFSPNLPSANCILHGDYSYHCQASFDRFPMDDPFFDKSTIPKEKDPSTLQTF